MHKNQAKLMTNYWMGWYTLFEAKCPTMRFDTLVISRFISMLSSLIVACVWGSQL